MCLSRRTIPVFSPEELATIDDLCTKGLDYGTAHRLVERYPDVVEFDYDRTFAQGISPQLWALAWQVVECVWDERYDLKITLLDRRTDAECGSTIVHTAGPNELDTDDATQLLRQIGALTATADTVSVAHAGVLRDAPVR